LHQIGITYYCSRYWALALPTFLALGIPAIWYFAVAIDYSRTPPLDSVFTITDEYATIQTSTEYHENNRSFFDLNTGGYEEPMSELLDLPLCIVNSCFSDAQ
jgi:phosphatidylinositol glycan class P protein